MRVNPAIKKEMEDGIQSVLSGKVKEFHANHVYPHMVERYLVPLGWKRGELDTNGWDYDWWLAFTKDGKSFTAYGSGYYGAFHFEATEE